MERRLPFSMIMGLEPVSLALKLLMVDRSLRGVLIRGTRGTGKSAIASAAASICPEETDKNDLLRIPSGVTEENLLGGPDLEEMISSGRTGFRSGILERANGRILLVDNINLLSDRIVDLILDCTGGGSLTVQRDGVSRVRAVSFKLIATMDSDEGRLRPQLLDRFDLSAEAVGPSSSKERTAILSRLLAAQIEGDRAENLFKDRDSKLRGKIEKARRKLPGVGIKVRALAAIVFASSYLEIDGHRPDIVMVKASGALAALRGRTKVIWDDVRDVAGLVTGHRTRKGGSQGPPSAEEMIHALRSGWTIGSRHGAADILLRLRGQENRLLQALAEGISSGDGEETTWSDCTKTLESGRGMFESEFPDFLETRALRKLTSGIMKRSPGGMYSKWRRSAAASDSERGRRVRVIPTDDPSRIDILETVKQALLQGARLPLCPIERSMWRKWQRKSRPRAMVMLVVDASKSSRGYLFGLSRILRTMFEEHFDSLSRIGLVSMTRGRVVLDFKPTRNRLRVYGKMKELISEGYSPLARALQVARESLQSFSTTGGNRGKFILLISDCAPEPLPPGCRDPFSSEVYGEVKKQALLCSRTGIPVVIIDPLDYPNLLSPEKMPGRRLARFIEMTTGGDLLQLPASIVSKKSLIVEIVGEVINRTESNRLLSQLNADISRYSGTSAPWLRG